MLLFLSLLTVQGVAMSAGDGFTLTPGGVHYHELQPGNGPVAETGDVATIHFRVWLARSGTQGKPFIESRSEDKSVSFIVGTGRILQGWNETVAGMRVVSGLHGSRRRWPMALTVSVAWCRRAVT